VLMCDVASEELQAFVAQHAATGREAEQLLVYAAPPESAFDAAGLREGAGRLEAGGLLTQESVVDLARTWRCLMGKWLLFVPEWRVDALFGLVAERLREGAMPGCTRAVVSPPGTYGTDPDKYMLTVHCVDFTDHRQVMALGKALRSLARQGLRAPAGDWGELRDDPFATRGKRVALYFKPDVFTYLNIHRKNPYGIRTTLHQIDL
ncbi:unnamed protein product, partial [Prorocentrum cordatum]